MRKLVSLATASAGAGDFFVISRRPVWTDSRPSRQLLLADDIGAGPLHGRSRRSVRSPNFGNVGLTIAVLAAALRYELILITAST